MSNKENQDIENKIDESVDSTVDVEVDQNISTESSEQVEIDEVAAAQEQCEQLEAKLAEINDKYLRLSADFDNFRKKAAQERIELIATAGKSIFTELLPVVDNFERALKSMESAQDVPALREGVDLIYNSFISFLDKQGVKAIECIGEQFSTDNQTAIAVIPAASPEQSNVVIDCTKKGYTLHDKVLRFAEVVVAK